MTSEAIESARRPGATNARDAASPRWASLPLILVVVTLVVSVVAPARQTWRIMRLLRQSTEVVEPARLLEARLELALAREAAALESYSSSGDARLLEQRREAQSDAQRRLDALAAMSRNLDPGAVARVAAVRRDIDEWRRSVSPVPSAALGGAALDAAMQNGQARYDSALASIATLASYLSDESADRGERIRAAERLSLAVNAGFVSVALGALVAVAALSRRERRLSAMLRRRVDDEANLREAAAALAAAADVDAALRQVAVSALAVLPSRGAVVEAVERAGDDTRVVVRAVSGRMTTGSEASAPFEGSLTQRVLAEGEPVFVPSLADAERSAARDLCVADAPALAVPLGGADGAPFGALFVVGEHGWVPRPDDLDRARTFGHLVTLASEKIRLLAEAEARRRELERVMGSRSRLMRGFSHDIKNPLSAADGHLALLAEGIHGPLAPSQERSVVRARDCLTTAFALIDYLHELARAETGHIALSFEPCDLVPLAATMAQDYRASAAARGLAIEFASSSDHAFVETDQTRVRQILGNLVSNAIKYTSRGTVAIRVTVDPQRAAENGDGGGVRVEVADTGPGIPADKLEAIFDEFTRIGGDGTSGAGLGLAISERLAEALGGTIAVESELGRGSIFALHLPLAASTALVPGGSRSSPKDAHSGAGM